MRVTQIQKEILVNFMEAHPNLINGKLGRNYPNGENACLWRELTHILNSSSGNVTKNAERWRKTWSDMKRDVKEKAARIREQHKQPFAMGSLEERLSPLQERLTVLVNRQEERAEDENHIEVDNEAKASYPGEVDSKTWHHSAPFSSLSLKQEEDDTYQESLYEVLEQDESSTPPRKKSRRLLHSEPSTSTSGPAEHVSSGEVSTSQCPEHQAATAAALNRLADVAERRLAVEERKAVAMERFVELFYKQQHN